MIVFKQPMRLALAKQQASENFLIRHTFKRQFSYLKIVCYTTPTKSFKPYQIQMKINMAENYLENESFDFELQEDTIQLMLAITLQIIYHYSSLIVLYDVLYYYFITVKCVYIYSILVLFISFRLILFFIFFILFLFFYVFFIRVSHL